MLTVQVDAAKSSRSLISSAPARPKLKADPRLKFWRRLIDLAMADAKRTYAGIPTHSAVLSRWWIQEHKPLQADKSDWERSFECACQWLDLNPDEERKRLLVEIDDALTNAVILHAGSVVYQLRAAVLTCAGIPTAICRQFTLGLVSEAEYDLIAGIDLPDPPAKTGKPRPKRLR